MNLLWFKAGGWATSVVASDAMATILWLRVVMGTISEQLSIRHERSQCVRHDMADVWADGKKIVGPEENPKPLPVSCYSFRAAESIGRRFVDCLFEPEERL